jgi:hypothetical protein
VLLVNSSQRWHRRNYDYACLRQIAPFGENWAAQMPGRENLSPFFLNSVLDANCRDASTGGEAEL